MWNTTRINLVFTRKSIYLAGGTFKALGGPLWWGFTIRRVSRKTSGTSFIHISTFITGLSVLVTASQRNPQEEGDDSEQLVKTGIKQTTDADSGDVLAPNCQRGMLSLEFVFFLEFRPNVCKTFGSVTPS